MITIHIYIRIIMIYEFIHMDMILLREPELVSFVKE